MAQLCTLPNELIEKIVQTLCLGCTDGLDRCCPRRGRRHPPYCVCDDTDRAQYTRAKALAALCRTSRWFNSMATHHLYHEPVGNLDLLARTLIARTDLAQLVRVLRLENAIYDRSYFSRETLEYLNLRYRTYRNMPYYEPTEDITEHPDDPEIALDILSGLCPNLETLYADIAHVEEPRHWPPQSMIRLQTLVVSCNYYHRYSSARRTVSMKQLARLFRAAPNITDLTIHRLTQCPPLGFTLDKFTSMDIRASVLSKGDFVNLLAMCPNLETLRYESLPRNSSLIEAKDAVLARAPKTLKYLRLAAGRKDSDERDWSDDEYEWDHDYASELGRALAERGIVFEYDPATRG